ncbi:hypothetical protein [Pseudonocardia sp.]|uniref:hypothetical protein n=1 Tax=Pseudonocardia sp. TaxID=60912 RepID=UPI002F4095BD
MTAHPAPAPILLDETPYVVICQWRHTWLCPRNQPTISSFFEPYLSVRRRSSTGVAGLVQPGLLTVSVLRTLPLELIGEGLTREAA